MHTLFRKIFLVDLLQGLRVTFRTQHPRNICTDEYPRARPKVAERFRGVVEGVSRATGTTATIEPIEPPLLDARTRALSTAARRSGSRSSSHAWLMPKTSTTSSRVLDTLHTLA